MKWLQGTRVTWLGHATVLVQTAKGTNILIDPFIEQNPKYPRSYQLPEQIHYCLLTHGHGDHTADAVAVATKHGATVVAIYELAAYMNSKGIKSTISMNLGGSVQLDDVQITMVEAKHSAGIQDEQGTHYVGVAAGFVLSIADGAVLYHAGDTAVFSDMRLIAELYHPQLAMLPIGGHFTMGPKEAAFASSLLSPKAILPLHFGTFPPLIGTPKELAQLVGPDVFVAQIEPGEALASRG